MKEIYYTLIFIQSQSQLLLGFKKRGFGKGTWNGYGGKIEKNEDAFTCAIRELHEESNLVVNRTDLNYLGVVTYHDNGTKRIVHIFTTNKTSGDLRETEEMKPKWFDLKNIPYDQMWPDSEYWIPLVLKNYWLYASFIYQNDLIVGNIVRKLENKPSITDVQNLDFSLKLFEQQNQEICVKIN